MANCEERNGEKKVSENVRTVSDENVSLSGSSTDDIPLKAEEYLKSDEVQLCTDPKLKREKQKLEDLLKSYRKLINKLDSKFETKEERNVEQERLSKVPEIYAILHPEIYKNPREDEKNKLIQKFSRRIFTPTDRTVPPICRTPPYSIHDRRQEEKERFVKILSSCPARFLNTVDTPATPSVKQRRPKYISLSPCFVPNEREAEKERLSKILATSGIYYRQRLDQKSNPLVQRKCFQNKQSFNSSDSQCSSPEKLKVNMVRVGEYSPLSSKEREPTLRGLCDSRTTSTYLPSPRKVLRSVTEEKVDRGVSTNDLEEVIEEVDEGDNQDIFGMENRKRSNSISTQTDPSDILDGNVIHTKKEDIHHAYSSPRQADTQEKVHFLSPREKLMSDLHGVSQCFPGVSSRISPRGDQDIKLKQAAYAKALQEQIEEKRKLEELKKKKEKQEEELIEQRIRLHEERLNHEMNDEQKKREDWLAQRQSHEEVLRRKMLEMQLEAQELKKTERRTRRDSDNVSEPRREKTYSKPPQTTLSEPSQRPRRARSQSRDRESRFDALRLAPLLDADTQNILSSYQSSDFAFPKSHSQNYQLQNGRLYGEKQRVSDKQKAEELLRKPLDFRIERPVSPPIPAVRTRNILNHKPTCKLLEDKWQVPNNGKELKRTQAPEANGRDNILTQLGAFRRKLHQEHKKLESRLQQQTP